MELFSVLSHPTISGPCDDRFSQPVGCGSLTGKSGVWSWCSVSTCHSENYGALLPACSKAAPHFVTSPMCRQLLQGNGSGRTRRGAHAASCRESSSNHHVWSRAAGARGKLRYGILQYMKTKSGAIDTFPFSANLSPAQAMAGAWLLSTQLLPRRMPSARFQGSRLIQRRSLLRGQWIT